MRASDGGFAVGAPRPLLVGVPSARNLSDRTGQPSADGDVWMLGREAGGE